MKLSKISGLAALLLSNAVLAESYQSFSAITYSHANYTQKSPTGSFYSEGDADTFSLYSQYFFNEKKTLGPLGEFDYINTSSNLYASGTHSNNKASAFWNDYNSNYEGSQNSVSIGGEWITHNVILGAGYSHNDSEGKGSDFSYDNSSNYYSASLGYLLSDDLVIRADYSDGGDGDDYFSYSASYNWQLAGTDYIGFSYNVDEDFDIHQLSSRYFFGFGEQSYLVLGGSYILDNTDNHLSDDYWSVNARYHYNEKTSISVTYDEGDYYSVNTSYFIDNNYSVQVGYNSVANNKDEVKLDGYYLNFTAQF